MATPLTARHHDEGRNFKALARTEAMSADRRRPHVEVIAGTVAMIDGVVVALE
jgi:hypothetical protein